MFALLCQPCHRHLAASPKTNNELGNALFVGFHKDGEHAFFQQQGKGFALCPVFWWKARISSVIRTANWGARKLKAARNKKIPKVLKEYIIEGKGKSPQHFL